MKPTRLPIEVRIAILYAIFGGLWILLSDSLLNTSTADPVLYARVQTYKGWFFVAASAILIFYLIKHEIAKRTETIEKLRVSEEQYRGLFEHMTEGYAYCKMLFENGQAVDWKYLTVNEAFESLTGLKEVTGKRVSEIIPGIRTSDPEVFEIYSRVALSGKPEKFELFLQALEMWFSVSVYSPEREYFVAVFDVITERKQAEEALRQTAEELDKRTRELNAILSSVQDYVYIFDPKGRFVFANKKLLDLWGLTAEQAIGKTTRDLDYPTSVEMALMDGVRHVLKTGQTVTNVTHYTSPSGVVGSYENILAPMLDSEKKVAFIAGSSRDITEREQGEDELKRILDTLKSSNAELEQFAYVASHDLQEPLRGIAGLAQLLQQRYYGQLDSQADEFINLIVDGTQRMQTLINDLLAYSRIGRRGETIQSKNAEDALQATMKNLDVAIQEYGARITHESLPTVKADATQLIQLFQNLIGNAIKFRSERPPEIHIGVTDAGDFWQFSVRDNGIGIESQYFERVFQVFQRLHTRREYKGTGIGLAICKKIIERHGGKIWVESEPGVGSTFYFTLPKGI